MELCRLNLHFSILEVRTENQSFSQMLLFARASLIKPVVFGFIISFVACYHGLNVQKASTEVPQRTLKAVVQSIFFIILFDVIFSLLIRYGLE